MMHPRELDANLLVKLDALLQTESVQEAAERLHLSPSATSHALARLRDVFDDPLLVRAGNQMVKTTRAEQLEPRIRQLVSDISAILEPEEGFDPETLERPFSMSTTDHIEFSLLPDLHRRVDERAPGVDL